MASIASRLKIDDKFGRINKSDVENSTLFDIDTDSEFDEEEAAEAAWREKGICCGHSIKAICVWMSIQLGLRSDKWPEHTILPTWTDAPEDPETGKAVKGKRGKGQFEIASMCGSYFSRCFRFIMVIIFLSLFIPLLNRDIDLVLQTDTLGPIPHRIADRLSTLTSQDLYI